MTLTSRPLMLRPFLRCFSTHANAWHRRRLQWLATGTLYPAPPPAGSRPERYPAAIDAARAARAASAAASRPIRIREHSVLAALRDPSRLVVFNRAMPLPSLIPILVQLWEEEALGSAPTPR
jgi:hypothetical protein